MINEKEKIRVIVVDDHRLFRMGLKSVFKTDHPEICVTGEADSSETLFALPELADADIVLLDVKIPGIGGSEIARRLRRNYPAIKILAISGENSSEAIQAMIEAGINGFISKQHGDFDEIAKAIRTVMSGLEYFGRDISNILVGVYVVKKKTAVITDEFTDREREIINFCYDGLMCKEIATRLGISITTVNTHKARIFQKLGINNTMEMVQYAIKNGIIHIDN
jgi:DNA-binding NarL/FixJ family response regulator